MNTTIGQSSNSRTMVMNRLLVRRRALAVIAAGAALLISSVAFAAIHYDQTIEQVEVNASGGGVVLFHMGTLPTSFPSCADPDGTAPYVPTGVIGCSLSSAECADMHRVALSAHLAGRTVDYELGSTCLSGVTAVPRIWRIRAN